MVDTQVGSIITLTLLGKIVSYISSTLLTAFLETWEPWELFSYGQSTQSGLAVETEKTALATHHDLSIYIYIFFLSFFLKKLSKTEKIEEETPLLFVFYW